MTDTPDLDASFRGQLGAFHLDVAISAPGRGVTALFGPSGCGKTTVLRCIAGLTRMLQGRCRLGDDVWQDDGSFRPAYRRPIGYVFQEASLFPHLSVRSNLLFGAPRSSSRSDGTDPLSYGAVVDLLGLGAFQNRSPLTLSGGERQRVAIGRALLSRPRLLLMDEPLSALDSQAKREILPFLERLPAQIAIPMIYVSHDISEVERLADHVVLMRAGRVEAAGPLADLQSDAALPLARAPQAAVVLSATRVSTDAIYGLTTFAVAGGEFVVPTIPLRGNDQRLRIAAADVSLALSRPDSTTILNVVPARIVYASPVEPNLMLVRLALGVDGAGASFLARITRKSWESLSLAPGRNVYAQVKSAALVGTSVS